MLTPRCFAAAMIGRSNRASSLARDICFDTFFGPLPKNRRASLPLLPPSESSLLLLALQVASSCVRTVPVLASRAGCGLLHGLGAL